MVNNGKGWGKAAAAAVLAVCLLGGLPSPALALKKDPLMYKGAEMMVRANKVMKEAVGAIQKGQALYVQICKDKGCVAEAAKGNQMIEAALQKADKGISLLEEGQLQYNRSKGKSRALAVAGVDRMLEGGQLVQAALQEIENAVKMNNEILRAKNLAAQAEAPRSTILQGTESGLIGMKQFLDGQKLFLEYR